MRYFSKKLKKNFALTIFSAQIDQGIYSEPLKIILQKKVLNK